MSMTTQQLIDLFMHYVGDTIATGSYWTNAKVISYLNSAYESLRQIVDAGDPEGEHLSTEAEASYPANTRWCAFSGVGRWTTAGRPLKIIDVRSISALAANEQGDSIPSGDFRMEYDRSSMYGGRYYMLQGDNIGLRDGYLAPSSAVVLRIRFVPAATRMDATLLTAVPSFVEGHYEAIAAKAACEGQQGEIRPIGDIAAISDEKERALKDYLSRTRHAGRPEIRVTQEMVDNYEFGH